MYSKENQLFPFPGIGITMTSLKKRLFSKSGTDFLFVSVCKSNETNGKDGGISAHLFMPKQHLLK